MTELTHVTEWMLRNVTNKPFDFRFRSERLACSGAYTVRAENMRFSWTNFAYPIHDAVPTCPACSILRDCALEGDVEKLLELMKALREPPKPMPLTTDMVNHADEENRRKLQAIVNSVKLF